MFDNQEENRKKTYLSPLKVSCVWYSHSFWTKKTGFNRSRDLKSHTGINKHHNDAAPAINTLVGLFSQNHVGLFSQNHNFCQRYHPRIYRHLIKPTERKESLFHSKISLLEWEKNSCPAELKERRSRHDWIEGLGNISYNSDH